MSSARSGTPAIFVRVRKIGRYEYLDLVENARKGGRHVQRVVKALGRRDEVENSDVLDTLIASAARHLRRCPAASLDRGCACRFKQCSPAQRKTSPTPWTTALLHNLTDTSMEPYQPASAQLATDVGGKTAQLTQAMAGFGAPRHRLCRLRQTRPPRRRTRWPVRGGQDTKPSCASAPVPWPSRLSTSRPAKGRFSERPRPANGAGPLRTRPRDHPAI